jgi:hypothetical protein
MLATAGTISARMIRIQRMTAVCGGIVLISAVALRGGDSGVTSSRFSGTASHLCRLEDLDCLDIRFLAPAAGLSFGRRAASFPFGVAERRDACGPELARRLRGEVDHDAVRVDTPCAAALVHLASGIDGFELDAHDSLANLAQRTKLPALQVGLLRFLVAWPRPGDLLV